MASHAELSPSKAHRWMVCPGSVAACRDIPEPPPGAAAQLGTATHALAEWCLREERVPEERRGEYIKNPDGSQFLCDQKMIDAVKGYLETVYALRSKHDAPVLFVEQRVRPYEAVDSEVYGTADALIVDTLGDMVDVVDLKNGASPVEVEDNHQLMIYGLGGLIEAPHASEVRLTVYQPHARDVGSVGPVRQVSYKAEDLRAWRNEKLTPAIQATKDPDAPRVTGKHCQYCPAFNVCPAHMASVTAVLREPKPLPGVDADALPAPENLTATQLGALLSVLPRFEAWSRAVRDFAKARILAGQDVPGWKVGDGRRTYSWENEDEAEATLKSLFPADWVFERKLTTPAKIRARMKASPADVRDRVEELIRCDRSQTVVPDFTPTGESAIDVFKEPEI